MSYTTAVVRESDCLVLATSVTTEADYEKLVNFHNEIKKIIQSMGGQSMWPCSVEFNDHFIHGVNQNNLCFMMAAGKMFPKRDAFDILRRVRKSFLEKYSLEAVKNAVRPYCFVEFGDDIKEIKRKLEHSPARHNDSEATQLNNELNSINTILMENIEGVLQRGKGLSSLDDQAVHLKMRSQQYRKDAKLLNTKSNMLKYGIFSIVFTVIMFLIVRYIFF